MIFSSLVFALPPKRHGKQKVTSTEVVIDCEETAPEGVDWMVFTRLNLSRKLYTSFSEMRGIQ